MMKMIKGHQCEIETYMLAQRLKWADNEGGGVGAMGCTACEPEKKKKKIKNEISFNY